MMRKTFWLVVVAGAALRIWQYAGNTSLWLDEIALAHSIVHLDLRALLFAPLPYDQVAPKGFLLVQKLAVLALGPTDYALRLFPFVCSLISLVVFSRLAKRMLDGAGPLVAMTLFATAAPLIGYGSAAKQYSVDVCVALVVWWLAGELMSQPITARRAIWAGAIGATLVWFSQPAVLMVASLGAVLFVWPHADTPPANRWRVIVPMLAAWGISALAVTVAGFMSMTPATREYMHRYWAAGFAPQTLTRLLDTRWPWDRFKLLFGTGGLASLEYPAPALFVLLTAAGMGWLWRRNRRTTALLIAPLAVTLVAAVAGQYPFSDRLILFLVPSFMLGIAAAIEGLRLRLWHVSRPLAALVAVGLLAPAVYPVAKTPPVYRAEDVKHVLAFVHTQWQPGDKIYVYYGAAPVTNFYASEYGFARTDYAVGGCHRGDSRRYLQELDTFRGEPRVWVVMTHSLPSYREREDLLAYLDQIGTRRDGLFVPSRAVAFKWPPAEAYLYDLSAADKLARVSAASFALSGSAAVDPRHACGEGPQAMVRSDFR